MTKTKAQPKPTRTVECHNCGRDLVTKQSVPSDPDGRRYRYDHKGLGRGVNLCGNCLQRAIRQQW